MIGRAAAIALLAAGPAWADAPVIEAAQASQSASGWRIDVTLSHPDTGWDHYADGWDVIAEDGTQLGLRALAHPHVAEQPFTRSLTGVALPQGTKRIGIRARCLTEGWAEDVRWINLPPE